MRRENRSWVLALLVVAVASASWGQTLTITNGADAGTVSFSSTINHDFTTVWNGYHTGIVCNTNADCAVDGEITFAANTSYTEAKSEVFLTSWAFNNGVSTGDEIGRIKAIVEQRSYDPSTGVYKWRAALRLDTTTSASFTAAYGFAIYRGTSSSKITITKNLNKSCTGTGGCGVLPSTNVVNIQPAGNSTFKGFLGRGFDLKTVSGNKGTLQRILVDVGVRASGTTSGGYAGQYNQKQGMNCGFEIVSSSSSPDPEDVSCTTYAVGFASEAGHGGYETTTIANAVGSTYFSYDPVSPTTDWLLGYTEGVPSTASGVEYRGWFVPFEKFELTYTNTIPLSTIVGAGCAQPGFFTTSIPNIGGANIFGLMRIAGPTGDPADAFEGLVRCYGMWARLGP